MGVGPVSGEAGYTVTPGKPPSWKLSPELAAATQGLVASGFVDLPYGRALFLEFGWAADVRGGAWLEVLNAVVTVSNGVPQADQAQSAALAFTWTGLAKMGLTGPALDLFARPFREGMFQEDRLRRLGDKRSGKWLDTVIDGGPRWSANTPLFDPTQSETATPDAFAVVSSSAPEAETTTPVTVHALLLLYTRDAASADALADKVGATLAPMGVAVVHTLDLLLDVEAAGISREHFGFADGLSQPVPYGLPIPIDETRLVTLNDRPAAKDPVQGVPLGEILLGYQNGHGEPAPGPIVPHQIGSDPADLDPRPARAGLRDHPLAEGFADLGINGSYLVVRELKQDVAAFWRSLEANAARLRAADPTATHITADWIAERVIGRGRDGHLLCPGGYLKPDTFNLPDSGYLFRERDPHGIGCPAGSHVRRAFPRDALAPEPTEDSRATLLQAANNHRILRRGRKFGAKAADPLTEDGEERGLLFMCLNTDIARQFEFVQQTWLLNSSFATLFGETDPLLGPPGPMTIRETPLRRTVSVESYIKMAGGDYFFLPSLPALAYLALL